MIKYYLLTVGFLDPQHLIQISVKSVWVIFFIIIQLSFDGLQVLLFDLLSIKVVLLQDLRGNILSCTTCR